MGAREILETYLNLASKNTLETDIFPHGTKSLLTTVTDQIYLTLICYFILINALEPSTSLSA